MLMTEIRPMYLTETGPDDDLILHLFDNAAINLSRPPYQSEGLGVVLLGNQGCGKSNAMAPAQTDDLWS